MPRFRKKPVEIEAVRWAGTADDATPIVEAALQQIDHALERTHPDPAPEKQRPVGREKPVELEAVQLRWDTWNDVCEFIGPFPDGMRGVYLNEAGEPTGDFPGDQPGGTPARIGLLIPTPKGTMLAVQGDLIVRGAQGELGIVREAHKPGPDRVS